MRLTLRGRLGVFRGALLLVGISLTMMILTGCGDKNTERKDKTSRGANRLTLAEEMKDEPRVVRKHDRAWQDEMVNRRREGRLKEALDNQSRKSKITAERAVTRHNYVKQRDTL